MDKGLFIEKYVNAREDLDMNQIEALIKRSVDSASDNNNPRGHKHLIIAVEELSELGQAITKALRGKLDRTNLLEELADVQISIYYLQEICGIKTEELNKSINVKLKRVENMLDDERCEFIEGE